MPNHITTNLTIEGSDENINLFKVECFSKEEDCDGQIIEKLDFEKVFPYPEGFVPDVEQNIGNSEYGITNIIFTRGDDPSEIIQKARDNGDIDLANKWQAIVDQCKKNIGLTGCAYFYDYNISKWGTKWNCYDFSGDEFEMSFDTAWSFPEPIIAEISKKI